MNERIAPIELLAGKGPAFVDGLSDLEVFALAHTPEFWPADYWAMQCADPAFRAAYRQVQGRAVPCHPMASAPCRVLHAQVLEADAQPKKLRTSPAQRARRNARNVKILDLHKRGVSPSAIATLTKCSYATVHRVIRAAEKAPEA
jgi:hypothetical protein